MNNLTKVKEMFGDEYLKELKEKDLYRRKKHTRSKISNRAILKIVSRG